MFGSRCKSKDKEPCFFERRFTSKKQQAIADREQELLLIAKELVTQEGFANLTMDKIAKESPYSKGTVYNHFTSKEDVITALCIMALKQQNSMFQTALTFEGNSREKALAFHVAYRTFSRLEPILFMCVLTAKTPWIVEKTSTARNEQLNKLEEDVIAMADGIFLKGIEHGDLKLSPALSTDTIVFANWAVAFGSNSLINNATNSRCISRIQDPYSLLHNINLVLDGLNWAPLSSDWDYKRTWNRIEQELFPTEIAHLESIGR
ncbi:TetR/AcrR family transcriptional regulator [Vibrio sp. Of7-15]|uniref:TetR/AcrR family transcriptional regulator n=1 Tax=Vibrio sp. Of7-15 TaxID=2724879 RepID=UPI001EF329CA|nr:TetR/AcrR family transcriptional regulator [Vibrio sp. Of7-15]MCG7495365.1 TetR/AcrR family transcriptional regulator [Vibrio sp. Of7-15]